MSPIVQQNCCPSRNNKNCPSDFLYFIKLLGTNWKESLTFVPKEETLFLRKREPPHKAPWNLPSKGCLTVL